MKSEQDKSTNPLNQLEDISLDFEMYLSAVLNNTNDPIFVKDAECRLLLVNDAFCIIFGLTRHEIIGKTLAENVTQEEREHFLSIDKQVLEEGKEVLCEETLTISGLQTKTILTRKNRFIDLKGHYFLIGVIHDITEKKKLEQEKNNANAEKEKRADELALANKELAFQNAEKDKRTDELVLANKKLAFQSAEKDKLILSNEAKDKLILANEENQLLLRELKQSQKMEALGKLTGGIAHEYNNMLGIMLGYSELLKAPFIDNVERLKYASQIEHAGNRATKLTSKLLTFSQNNTPNADSVNLNTLLQQQYHMLEKTLTISISLVYELQENLWQVWLDGGELEDTILNMCINAMHAMSEHGHLTIETCNKTINQNDATSINITAGDYVLLSFTDNGCGFDKETKEKIFDPFFTTKGQLGTGLGLSIVYGFVQNSGGVIDVESIEGEGTQFTFYFPRYHGTHDNKQSEIQNPHEVSLIGNKTILVVDDEPDLLELTRENLMLSGFNIFCAGDATQALAIMEHESIDLLISDVLMAGIDGYQLAAIVKEKYPNIKIQLVSGFSGSRNIDMVDENTDKIKIVLNK